MSREAGELAQVAGTIQSERTQGGQVRNSSRTHGDDDDDDDGDGDDNNDDDDDVTHSPPRASWQSSHVAPVQFWGSGVPRWGGGVGSALQAAAVRGEARGARRRQQPGEWCATWAWTTERGGRPRGKVLRPPPRAANPLEHLDERIERQERELDAASEWPGAAAAQDAKRVKLRVRLRTHAHACARQPAPAEQRGGVRPAVARPLRHVGSC
jgi:hypothetical protein